MTTPTTLFAIPTHRPLLLAALQAEEGDGATKPQLSSLQLASLQRAIEERRAELEPSYRRRLKDSDVDQRTIAYITHVMVGWASDLQAIRILQLRWERALLLERQEAKQAQLLAAQAAAWQQLEAKHAGERADM